MVKISPQNLVVVTVLAVVGMAALRMVAARFGISGLTELVG